MFHPGVDYLRKPMPVGFRLEGLPGPALGLAEFGLHFLLLVSLWLNLCSCGRLDSLSVGQGGLVAFVNWFHRSDFCGVSGDLGLGYVIWGVFIEFNA